MEHKVQIRCKNNKKSIKVNIGTKLSEVFDQINLQMPHPPVCARVNNMVEGMHYRVYHSKDVEYLDITSAPGSRTYTRGLFFVLCKAVHDIYPDGSVIINTPVSNGYYCELRIGREVTEADVDALRNRMQQCLL